MSLGRFRKNKGKMDYWLLFLVFGLCVFGLLMVYSSSAVLSFEQHGINNYYFKKQLISLIIGLVGMGIASFIDYRFWKKYSVLFLRYGIVSLSKSIGVFKLSTKRVVIDVFSRNNCQ